MPNPVAAIVASTAVGAGTSLYGANKQAKADAAALAANREQVDKTNQLNWSNYLMQRGIAPSGAVEPGAMPSSGTPINTRLPLWATVRRPAAAGFRVAGMRPRLAVQMPGSAPAPSAPSTLPAARTPYDAPIDYGRVFMQR